MRSDPNGRDNEESYGNVFKNKIESDHLGKTCVRELTHRNTFKAFQL
jgi:hypothetical protein